MTDDTLLQLTCVVDLQAADGKPPKLEILAYSGSEIQPAGMGPVIIDLSALKFAAQIPVAVDHNTSLSGLVGHGTPTIEANNLIVRGVLIDANEASKQVLTLTKSGFRFEASVGVQMHERQFVKAGENVSANGKSFVAGPRGITLVKSGTLREVSILALAADDRTSVSIAASKGKVMPEVTTTTTTDPAAIRAEERERLKKIDQLTAGDFGSEAGAIATLRAQAVAGEIDTEALAANMVNLLRARPPAGVTVFRPGPRPGAAGAVTADTLAASLMIRAGYELQATKVYGEQISETARRLRIGSLCDLAAHALKLDGLHAADYDSHDQMLKAAFSTVNLPNILSQVVGRVLVRSYEETTSSWKPFAFVASAADFRPQQGIRPTAIESLQQVGATGELKHGVLAEEGVYPWQVGTFGRILGISRVDLVNDDLGFVSQVAPMLGVAGGRALNDLVWKTVLGGQTAGFFSAGNSNLMTTGSALATTTLATGISMLRKQVDSAGNSIFVAPQALVVCPELEMTGRSLLSSTLLGKVDGQPTGNPLVGVVPDLVVEARLSNSNFVGNSATGWYLFGPPISRGITIGFLQGKFVPTIEIAQGEFDTLGIQLRCYFDFGVALSDARACLKATGAP